MSYQKIQSLFAMGLAMIVVAAVGCGTATVTKSASPEDAFNNMKSAAEAKDWKKFCGCMTADSVDGMAGGMAMLSILMSDSQGMGDKEAAEKIAAAMKKYNVSEDTVGKFNHEAMMNTAELKKIGAKVNNKAEFIGAIMEVVTTMKDGPGNFEFNSAKIADVKIDGNSATGKATGMGPKEQVMKFKKVDGNWLVEYDLNG